jgi:hypothetical protein
LIAKGFLACLRRAGFHRHPEFTGATGSTYSDAEIVTASKMKGAG